MNNKVVYGVVGVVLVLLLVVGGIFVVRGRNAASQATDEGEMEIIPSINADELGLTLELTPDNKNVKLIMANLKGITHIEYEITYDANSKDPEARAEGVKVPRGFGDEKDITNENEKFESKDYFLGTCSSGTCIPDVGVEKVTATVKITKVGGKIYQSETSLDL